MDRRTSFAAVAGALLAAGLVSQAQADYVSTVLGDSPVTYWRFEETSGTAAADSAPLSGTTNGIYNGITLGVTSAHPLLGNAATWNPGNGSSFVDLGGTDGAGTNLPWLVNYRP